MPQHFADRVQVDTQPHQDARARVAQVMEVHLRQAAVTRPAPCRFHAFDSSVSGKCSSQGRRAGMIGITRGRFVFDCAELATPFEKSLELEKLQKNTKCRQDGPCMRASGPKRILNAH